MTSESSAPHFSGKSTAHVQESHTDLPAHLLTIFYCYAWIMSSFPYPEFQACDICINWHTNWCAYLWYTGRHVYKIWWAWKNGICRIWYFPNQPKMQHLYSVALHNSGRFSGLNWLPCSFFSGKLQHSQFEVIK